MAKLDKKFYRKKSWGSMPIQLKRDLPSLKLRYLLNILAHRKKKDANLLEIGCGSGRILTTIQEHEPDMMLTGVDLDEEQVNLAKRDNKDRRIVFKQGNAEKLPFRKESFDFVIFLDVIEHVENPDMLLDEAVRVLKPGGLLYGVSPCEAHGIYRLSTKLLGWHIKEKTAGHIQQFQRKEFVAKVGDRLDILDVKYSYHLLGSIMDYTLFTLLLNGRIADLFWSKNKYYLRKDTEQTMLSRTFNLILGIANAIAYYESKFLKNLPATATAVHVVAQKQ